MTHNPTLPPYPLPCERCGRIRPLLPPGLCLACAYPSVPGRRQLRRHRAAVDVARIRDATDFLARVAS